MKLSLTPALGFSSAPSPRPEASEEARALRPKGRRGASFEAVRPIVADPPSTPEVR